MPAWMLWTAGYILALFAEVSFLPSFFGASVPALHGALLILGIAFQRFWPGFWFAGLAGFARGILIPEAGGAVLFAALAVFFAMRLYLALEPFAMPLERIGAIAVGIVTAALIRAGAGFFGRPALGEFIFAAAWFLLIAGLIVRVHERRRREVLTRLR